MGKVLMTRGLTSNSTIKHPNSDIHKMHENKDPTWQTNIQRVAVQFSKTFVGETMVKQFIKLLWILEKTAIWISKDNDQKVKADGKRAKVPASLVRPLPWVFFLPTLVALRFSRVMLSLISISIGFGYIEASMMVRCLHETRRKMQHVLLEADQNKYRDSITHHDKHNIPPFLSNTNNLISQLTDTLKSTYNKTALKTFDEADDQNSSNSEDSDTEDKIYHEFKTRPIVTSDSDDDDFICDLVCDDVSDTDSQSSIATDDLSDGVTNEEPEKQSTYNNDVNKPTVEITESTEEIAKPTEEFAKPAEEFAKPSEEVAKPTDEIPKPTEESAKTFEESAKPFEESAKPNEDVQVNTEKGTNGNARMNDEEIVSNYPTETTTVDQPMEVGQAYDRSARDVQPTSENAMNYIDIAADRVMEEASKAADEKSGAHNRTKNINRQHKNGGRNNAKNQNNGKHYNGGNGHAQTKTKSVKQHQVESTADFISEAATSDRT